IFYGTVQANDLLGAEADVSGDAGQVGAAFVAAGNQVEAAGGRRIDLRGVDAAKAVAQLREADAGWVVEDGHRGVGLDDVEGPVGGVGADGLGPAERLALVGEACQGTLITQGLESEVGHWFSLSSWRIGAR